MNIEKILLATPPSKEISQFILIFPPYISLNSAFKRAGGIMHIPIIQSNIPYI
jgi:hypothetical protein